MKVGSRNPTGGRLALNVPFFLIATRRAFASNVTEGITSEETERALLLAVQKPEVLDINKFGSATVEFQSGPNKAQYGYEVACYAADPEAVEVSCGDLGTETPVARVTGSLPYKYSTVKVEVDGFTETVVDCYVTVEGLRGIFSQCSYAGRSSYVPEPPGRVVVSAVDVGPLQRNVTWTSSPFTSQAVSGYEVVCTASDGDTRSVSAANTATSVVIGSGTGDNAPLAEDKAYECGLRAFNAAGEGPMNASEPFRTDVLVAALGNGVPQDLAYPTWDLDAWYSGFTSVDSTPILGLYSTMPTYFWEAFPPSAWTDTNDAILNADFMTFEDVSFPGSDSGYLQLTNGISSSTRDRADLINWFGKDGESMVVLPTLFASGGSFGVEFRAAISPENSQYVYFIETICRIPVPGRNDYLATPSLVYRFTNDVTDWATYSFDNTSPFGIYWTTQDASIVTYGPVSSTLIALDGSAGGTSDVYTYDDWMSSTNDILRSCLKEYGSAFGSGFSIGPESSEWTLKLDWLLQSFTRDGARINFITPP